MLYGISEQYVDDIVIYGPLIYPLIGFMTNVIPCMQKPQDYILQLL